MSDAVFMNSSAIENGIANFNLNASAQYTMRAQFGILGLNDSGLPGNNSSTWYNNSKIILVAGNGRLRLRNTTSVGYRISLYGDTGNASFSGTVSSGSDDRWKINERPITNAMQTLSNLQFYEYDKLLHPMDTEGFTVERGVIAQHLLGTPLEYAVKTSDEDDAKLSVTYQDVLITAAQAVKDLMAQVQTLQDRVAALEAA